jgi:hypothetical protein
MILPWEADGRRLRSAIRPRPLPRHCLLGRRQACAPTARRAPAGRRAAAGASWPPACWVPRSPASASGAADRDRLIPLLAAPRDRSAPRPGDESAAPLSARRSASAQPSAPHDRSWSCRVPGRCRLTADGARHRPLTRLSADHRRPAPPAARCRPTRNLPPEIRRRSTGYAPADRPPRVAR